MQHTPRQPHTLFFGEIVVSIWLKRDPYPTLARVARVCFSMFFFPLPPFPSLFSFRHGKKLVGNRPTRRHSTRAADTPHATAEERAPEHTKVR